MCPRRRLGSDYFAGFHSVSCVAFRMMEEAGVEMILSTHVADPFMEGDRVVGLLSGNSEARYNT